MDKKGVAELKRRFTKENCTFTRLCGCYVDAGKNKVVDLSEIFLKLLMHFGSIKIFHILYVYFLSFICSKREQRYEKETLKLHPSLMGSFNNISK